jgi:hypothetical protein
MNGAVLLALRLQSSPHTGMATSLYSTTEPGRGLTNAPLSGALVHRGLASRTCTAVLA